MSRIAYVLGGFPVMSETFIGNEMRAMEARGHTVFPIALHRPQAEFQPEDKALAGRTHYFSAIDPETSKRLIRHYFFKLYRLLPFALAQTSEPFYPLLVHAAHLASYIKEKGCTHVHAHFAWGAATYAIAAAKLLKLPVTFTCHGSDVYARPIDIVVKCRSATSVFAVAPSITADIQKLSRTPCHLVYCGVDTDRFRPAVDESRRHGRWLFAGRLIDCKGADDILSAWTRLPSGMRPHLDIVGDGALRQALEAQVVRYGLTEQVTFLGVKPSVWIAEHGPYYRAFVAAFKQGSDGSRDTAPMVLKEAMAMGLPIVTTAFADVPEVVGTGAVLLCPVSSPDKLADAVMSVQSMTPDAWRAMGRAGRARVEQHYSLQRQAERIAELFERYAR